MSSGITSEVFETYRQHPKVAVLMSRSGTNAESILSNEELRDLYDVRTIVTDNPTSNAAQLSDRFDIALTSRPFRRFTGLEGRVEYFTSLKDELGRLGVDAAIYAGFMKITTPEFCEAFPGVNVHPADLSIKGADGLAKYRGMDALSQMRRDLGRVAATVHVVDNPVDSGSAISISAHLDVGDSSIPDNILHNNLKELEHVIFPQTLVLMGKGVLLPSRLPYNQSEIEELYHVA